MTPSITADPATDTTPDTGKKLSVLALAAISALNALIWLAVANWIAGSMSVTRLIILFVLISGCNLVALTLLASQED